MLVELMVHGHGVLWTRVWPLRQVWTERGVVAETGVVAERGVVWGGSQPAATDKIYGWSGRSEKWRGSQQQLTM